MVDSQVFPHLLGHVVNYGHLMVHQGVLVLG